jgi:hypothetical protein
VLRWSGPSMRSATARPLRFPRAWSPLHRTTRLSAPSRTSESSCCRSQPSQPRSRNCSDRSRSCSQGC